jgi:DNA-entry nuclease
MIDGQVQSLYNRAHLIAYQLTAEEDNPKNLITSTRQLNDPAMEFYETETAWYIRKTGHHVRYQVTPVFVGDNLLANGVHMMARSIEDNGVSFNIYIFNVQPKVNIDYKTGLASGSIIQYNYDN